MKEFTKEELMIIDKLVIKELAKKEDEKLKKIAKKLIEMLAD